MHKELKATLLLLGWTGTASDTRWLKTENNRPITSLYLLKSAVVVCNLENENEQKKQGIQPRQR